jgi:serine/threonine-protein kinase
MQYADAPPPIPQIAAELNVGAVMECSVRYAGNAILVTAQLIDPETNSHLWSDTYPGDLSDLSTVFAMQADIAMNIANAVGAEFSLEEQENIEAVPTDSPAAYALYLSALRRGGSLNDVRLSIQELDAAIRLDPEFALAYAQRAWQYARGLIYSQEVPVTEYERDAVASAEQALALDPAIGLAHSVIAAIDELNWRWADARRRSELAFRLSPNDVTVLSQYVRFTRSAGEYDESISENERWAQLEPSSFVYNQLAVAHRYARNYDAAVAAARKAIDLAPATTAARVQLAYAETARGNRDEAVRVLQVAEQLFGGNFDQVFRVGQMAMTYSLLGRRGDAERMLALLEELDRESPVGEAIWAQVHIALENYDEALQQLEAAMDSPAAVNYTTLIEIKANPWAIPELDTPRFREVLSGLWSVD